MNKKKLNRILSNLMTLTMMCMMLSNTCVYAALTGPVRKILVDVTEVLLTIAGLVCTGKLIQIGIMYMTSSAVDKSNAKSAVLPWLIGTIVCFGASWIGSAVIGLFSDISGKDVLSY